MEIETINQFILQLENMLVFLKKIANQQNLLPMPPKDDTEALKEFTELRFLLKNDEWSEAVSPDSIATNDGEHFHKAAIVLKNLVTSDMFQKTILDFGCKDGYLAYVACNLYQAKRVVGYDTKDFGWEKFEQQNTLTYTTDWKKVCENKYDIIILHDVIDHYPEFEKVFEQIKEIKKEDTKIFVRCHPWTSRHGAHLHQQINKAFMHLIFSEDELSRMGYEITNTHQLLNPTESYKNLFKNSGLTVLKENKTTRDVEYFFVNNPAILRRIKEKWKNSTCEELASGTKFPQEYLEIEFIDYTLI